MTATATAAPAPARPATGRDHRGSWLPTGALISTKFLELRRRRILMVFVVILTLGLPFLVLGLRLLFHAIDPSHYGPAGSPSVFEALCDPLAEFGFIIAAAVGATAGTTDLNEGMFRHLVITGRSRVALYLARIPAGLAIVLPLMAIGFASLCLVTAFEGTPQPTSVTVDGVTVPFHLSSQTAVENYLLDHPAQIQNAFGGGPGGGVVIRLKGSSASQSGGAPPSAQTIVRTNIGTIYQTYLADSVTQLNPPVNEMVKVGLWIELELTLGFLIGCGLGSLTGERTVTVIILLALQLILTPIFAAHVIPYFLNGQRIDIGIAMDQLRPVQLVSTNGALGGGGNGPKRILGGRAALQIPPMATWAMITVIVGWAVGWTGIGAWRMATRDA